MKLEETEVQLDKAKSRLKKMKKLRPDRGIETMFRTTYRTHINLSSIADNKANILLSIMPSSFPSFSPMSWIALMNWKPISSSQVF